MVEIVTEPNSKQAPLSKERAWSLYSRMYRIRAVEEAIATEYVHQEMRCPVHLSIGQEAAAAAMCEALKPSDLVYTTHRCHGHYLAKGGSLRKMMAEIYGKDTGCIRGLGGSMHLMDPDHGIAATVPIVGGNIPIAVGTAFANKYLGNNKVTVAFLGDAAVEEGAFHESINFAVLHKLPVVFFCENNFYSVYTHLDKRQPRKDILSLVKGFPIKAEQVDGNDVEATYKICQEAADYTRAGKGPVFVEAITYRWREHCGPNFDNDIGYRTPQEFEQWKEKCPVNSFENKINSLFGTEAKDSIAKIQKKVHAEIEDAFDFAKKSEFPPVEILEKYVYAK